MTKSEIQSDLELMFLYAGYSRLIQAGREIGLYLCFEGSSSFSVSNCEVMNMNEPRMQLNARFEENSKGNAIKQHSGLYDPSSQAVYTFPIMCFSKV